MARSTSFCPATAPLTTPATFTRSRKRDGAVGSWSKLRANCRPNPDSIPRPPPAVPTRTLRPCCGNFNCANPGATCLHCQRELYDNGHTVLLAYFVVAGNRNCESQEVL